MHTEPDNDCPDAGFGVGESEFPAISNEDAVMRINYLVPHLSVLRVSHE